MSGLLHRIGHFTGTAAAFQALLGAAPHRDPTGLIRGGLENRERNFLDLARRVIFSNPANPYHRMFRLAGCGFEDLSEAVSRDGLEPTLASLHRQGVYVSHDEFKMKAPIVRANQQIAADEESFRNPLVQTGMVASSGGSRSQGTKARSGTAARLHREAYDSLAVEEFALARRPHALLKPILPAIDGLMNLTSFARRGCMLDRWFSPVARSADSTHYRLATYSLVALARLRGVRIPFPVDLPANDFSPVARWIAERCREGMPPVVITYASPAVRAAAAAAGQGLAIDDALFLVGGETLTDSKRQVIESAGAQVFPRYSITEFGAVGHACRQMNSGDSVHLFSDSIAVVSHRRQAPLSGAWVDSLLFTSLLPCAPHVLINAEMDDSGEVGQASCDCAYSRLGLTRVLRNISSFGKLTGHGVTLVGTDIVHILEEVLPARFGGCATDYQLVETDGGGQANLALRVSRSVPLASLDEVKNYFLRQLRQFVGGETASRLWLDAGAVEVVHEDPIATARGKILPLHLLGGGARFSSVAAHES